MSQYPVRTGPITNNAAPFSPEMVQGNHPDTALPFVLRQTRGWNALGTVEPPADAAMTQGVTMPKARAFPPKKDGWATAQTTFDAAPFASSMSAGIEPAQPRVFVEFPSGWFSREPDILFAAIEETAGSHPDQPRQFPAARGPSVFPWSGTPAAFSPEMHAGALPDRSRAQPAHSFGWQVITLVDAFDITMVIGSKPDRPFRWQSQMLPPVGDVPSSVMAPFAQAMVVGVHADANRAYRSLVQGEQRLGAVEVFSAESAFGQHPDLPRLFSGPRPIGWSDSQLTPIALLTPDMVVGVAPVSPRLFKSREPAQIQPLLVTILSPDMTQGWHPDRPSFFTGPRTVGWQTAQPTPIAVFGMEMVAGTRLDRARFFVRTPLGWQGQPADRLIFQAIFATLPHPLSPEIAILLETTGTVLVVGPFQGGVFLSGPFATNK